VRCYCWRGLIGAAPYWYQHCRRHAATGVDGNAASGVDVCFSTAGDSCTGSRVEGSWGVTHVCPEGASCDPIVWARVACFYLWRLWAQQAMMMCWQTAQLQLEGLCSCRLPLACWLAVQRLGHRALGGGGGGC